MGGRMVRRIFAIGLGLLALTQTLGAQTPPGPEQNLRVSNEVRIYQMDKDAVVNITSTRVVNARVGTGDEIFDRFFGPTVVRAVPSTSLGSGFVIHPSGYILTNEHVIDRASEVNIVLANGDKLPAVIIATDTEHDLAILKVAPAKPLQAIRLGVSDDLMIGEPVYAIGNPFGFSGSMTRGIVSALARELTFPGDRVFKGLIQTDASINPGNSGGPLLNAYGQVIGVNTAIKADANGIGFAIGISTVRDSLPQLLQTEVTKRVQLGFTLKESRTIAPPAQIGVAVLIAAVQSGSEAEKVGLRVGDHVVAVGETPADTIVSALVACQEAKAGAVMVLRIEREGKLYEAKVPVTPAPPPESERILLDKLGVEAISLTPALARQYGLSVSAGIMITSVRKGSPAATGGLQAQDIINQIGPYYVTTNDDAATLLKSATKRTRVRLGIIRGDARGLTMVNIN